MFAYNIPGLLYLEGPQLWDQIRGMYNELSTKGELRTRKTLASSFHEVAKILKSNSLIAIFHDFCNDIEEIRRAVLANIEVIMPCIPQQERSRMLDICCLLYSQSETSWRTNILKGEKVIKAVV